VILAMKPERSEEVIGRDNTSRIFVVRVKGQALVRTNQLVDAQWAVRAAAQAGEGAEIVDDTTDEVIEQHPPRYS
jgi:hypothetical protein